PPAAPQAPDDTPRQDPHPRPRGTKAEAPRVPQARTRSRPRGRGRFPDLEALGVGTDDVAIRLDPLRGVPLHQRRLEPLDPLARDPEHADAARTAQILARGAGQRVAAETTHVERDLADRLRRVEQEEHARLA